MKLYFCFNLAIIIFVLIIDIELIKTECPINHIIKPCVCTTYLRRDTIYCGGNNYIDLENIFNNISKHTSKEKKHFYTFQLNNTAINELKENTFKDITFDEILIQDCNNLTKLTENTFQNNNFVTKIFYLQRNTKLIQTENYSIFNVLSKFVNIEFIFLNDNNVKEIPSNAFKPFNGFQNKLKEIYIRDKVLKNLGENSFFSLDSLTTLSFFGTSINSIPKNAFNFEKYSNQTLNINLYNNPINSTSFAFNSLIYTKRPTHLVLSSNNITYLDEKIFLPFFGENNGNLLYLLNVRIDCMDCRNYWLIKYKEYISKIYYMICSNGNQFQNGKNFKDCQN